MKTKQYAAHPLTTTQSELPSAILSALTIALLSALLFTSCSKHHYLELFLDPDGEPIENPGRILLSAPGVANPLGRHGKCPIRREWNKKLRYRL